MPLPLVADWRRVLSRAWSMRLVYLAVLVLVLAEVAQWAVEIAYLPPIWSLVLRLIGVALMIAAIPARVLLQKEFHDE
jgi:hypothetical protein